MIVRYKTISAIYISFLHISVVILSLWIFIHISCWQIQNKPNYTHITSTCWVTKSTIIDVAITRQSLKQPNIPIRLQPWIFRCMRQGGATSGVTIWRSPSWRRWQTTIYGTGSLGYHTSWKNSILNKAGMDVMSLPVSPPTTALTSLNFNLWTW